MLDRSRRHPRPRPAQLGRIRQRRGHRFPDPEPALRRLRAWARTSRWRIGVAIGDQVLDLQARRANNAPGARGVDELLSPLAAGDLNTFMALGGTARRTLRAALSQALVDGSDQGPFLELCLVSQAAAQMAMPCRIGDYTDFYTGIHHATAVGKLFRPTTRCCPTTSGCRSATTAARRQHRRQRPELRSADGADRTPAARRRVSARASASTTNSSSASSSAPATHWASR